ncbi:SixA phosphatase family protein [Leptospira meyeri]|uniref:Phosphohistidine phosphatase n=1 Tax=Leptospira meyeri TaxID=29508 RepID=A0A4R8N2M1_LEPME|nr:histidine phosphatase family protein [Leptospira meyeri]PKA26025.1 histidine phosphatase family protein [Leptospira sp. mixed culture ATI2-C-A1]EKJ87748.1 putative phosphohistidine phosphatase SixA [Leptospira meyeri serovar Hardjo str. Went 5]EMJ88743.1 putative phosphohistidine phosphatase SixA [Leptospira meyeri serovar Semaranga str. Veldrot Semarang 173]MCW7488076.1 histidine phosphatase family protein [Leptospira meyeri]PJZ81618.1 histidine phosphatase family protein [Leptospira meyer
MKQIYLLRHAKSEWDEPYDSDLDRSLSRRGKEQTKALREYLKESRFEFDQCFVSPAERTQKTYTSLRKEILRFPKPELRESIYDAEKEDLLFLLQGLTPAVRSVCLVGHNPGLEELGSSLLFGDSEVSHFQKFPTAAFLGLSFSKDSWKDLSWGSCQLSVFWIPGQIGKE